MDDPLLPGVNWGEFVKPAVKEAVGHEPRWGFLKVAVFLGAVMAIPYLFVTDIQLRIDKNRGRHE